MSEGEKTSFSDVKEIVKKINSKILEFTERLEEDYSARGGSLSFASKKGVLDDKIYMEDFVSCFLEPHTRDITHMRTWTLDVVPFVYYDLTWVRKWKVREVIFKGYRTSYSSFWSRIDTKDLIPHKTIEQSEDYFNTYVDLDIANLGKAEKELVAKIENSNKAIYCEIIKLSKKISEEGKITFLDLARTLFQWAFGMILNYFNYQYKIDREVIEILVGVKPNVKFTNLLERLNKMKEMEARDLLRTRIVEFLLQNKIKGLNPSYKDFLTGTRPINGIFMFSKPVASDVDIKGKKPGTLKEAVKKVTNECIGESPKAYFIHQNNRYGKKGKANHNKIYKKIANEYPDIIEDLSSRRVIDLIKDELPSHMK